jgi:hypothetical protein
MNPKYFVIALMLICLSLSAKAQDMPVPVELQVAIFKKVFSYDKAIQAGSPKMLVVFTDKSADVKDQIVKAFKDSGMAVNATKADQLSGALGSINILYVAPGVSGIKNLCQKNGILSITGIPSMVESGEASVGLSVIENKPKIIVHLKQLKSEGHELSANLLQLAKVIQ